MGYTSTRKARLEQQLTRTQAALTAAYSAFTELTGSTVESYTFDSGEGLQKVKRRGVTKQLNEIKRLEATEAHLINQLHNMGLVTIRLRRNV